MQAVNPLITTFTIYKSLGPIIGCTLFEMYHPEAGHGIGHEHDINDTESLITQWLMEKMPNEHTKQFAK